MSTSGVVDPFHESWTETGFQLNQPAPRQGVTIVDGQVGDGKCAPQALIAEGVRHPVGRSQGDPELVSSGVNILAQTPWLERTSTAIFPGATPPAMREAMIRVTPAISALRAGKRSKHRRRRVRQRRR